MRYAILDTNVYIDHWEGRHSIDLETVRNGFIVRQSAVVLSELRRGARTAAARKLVDALYKLAPEVWAPTDDDWWQAGELIRVIGDEQGWETGKRRELQNDVLIALTAQRHGATVVTRNASDFELIAKRVKVKLLVV